MSAEDRAGIALAVLAVLGLWALSEVVDWWALLAIPLAIILRLLAELSVFCKALTQVVGAIVVPWLSLLGFNLLWYWVLRDVRPGLWLGLLIAVLVFALVTAVYLLLWKERKWAVPFVAIALAVVNVAGVPLLIGATHHEAAVAAPQRLVSELDVAIVVPRTQGHALAPLEASAQQPDWDVRYSVARTDGENVEWLLLDSPDAQAALLASRGTGVSVPGTPTWRADADQLVLLDVDGTPAVTPHPAELPSVPGMGGEVNRWLRGAERIAPHAPIAALLQTTDPQRLASWTKKVEPRGGSVASVQDLGTPTLTEAALRLAADAPSSTEDLSLALRFRPILLFDSREQLDAPLDIDAFLRSDRVMLCHDDRLAGSRCSRVSRPSDLINGSTHLRISPHRTPSPVSSIYVHPTAVQREGRKLLYLDYWWYLDDNPAKVGRGISCGVGLALPGKTCFDHESDWEGMIVVVDRSGPEATPVAVQYAEHSDVVRYGFAQLHAHWEERLRHDRSWLTRRARRKLAALDDRDLRPLAFIALGTHAAYAESCPSRCHQVAKGLTEHSRDGLVPWPDDDTARCIADTCLRLLPTRHGGRDPALWNAYEGVWGDRHCILLGGYCSAELSPAAPASQGRYKKPARISGVVDARWVFRACGSEASPCPALARL